MKTDLRKRLGFYSLAAGAVVAGTDHSEAQIVYRDIDPDATVTGAGSNYLLDLNNDATNDFEFKIEQWSGGTAVLYLSPLNNNAVLGEASSSGFSYKAAVVNAGDPIAHTPNYPNSWVGTAMMAVNGATANYGPFKNASGKFVGLRLVTSTNDTLYGWVRLNVDIANLSFTVRDVAFNSTDKASINGGQTVASALKDPALEKGTIIFVNEANEICIKRENEALMQEGTAEIISLDGKVMASEKLTSNTVSIPAQEVSSGLVIVRVSYEKGAVSRTLFVR